MSKIIGIDLGTTTSEIAYIKNGKPELIPNNLGDRITPSVVGLSDEGDYIVGVVAKRQYALKSDRTVMEAKRKMGTNETFEMGERAYLPQEISAILLEALKRYAEDYIGETVTEAVITVPAGFDDLQRQATKEAGEKAGFKVERIINEPTAAALAYGINNLETEEKVLVYDLGGGTFDVTVLELFEGVLDIQSSRGNNQLGGKDFDEAIEQYLMADFKSTHGIDLSNNKKSRARIKEAAEIAKKELTTLESTMIELPFIAIDESQNPLELSLKLTRSKFEALIKTYLDETEVCINQALEAAGYRTKDIDVVLAVGGSSRVPCVRRLLEYLFPGKVKTEVNPDEAVALGAAVQAGIKNDEISAVDSVLITDVCRYTLGIDMTVEADDGRHITGVFDPLILKDSKIPTSSKKQYYTLHNEQDSVIVSIYQGDDKWVANNLWIGEMELGGIPKGPAGAEGISIEFSYDINGVIQVEATVLSTGQAAKKIIDLKGRTAETTKNTGEDKGDSQSDTVNLEEWIAYPLAKGVKNTVRIAEKKLESMNAADQQKVQTLIVKIKEAVIANNEDALESLDETLTDLLFDIE